VGRLGIGVAADAWARGRCAAHAVAAHRADRSNMKPQWAVLQLVLFKEIWLPKGGNFSPDAQKAALDVLISFEHRLQRPIRLL
jgi:hypothetical protein